MKTIASTALPAHVQQPRYDREQLRSRIVHFGFGAFHRAHQALLTNRVLNARGGDWGICEISLFSGDVLMRQLRAQDHLFTVLEKGAEGNQPIIIGAVKECLNAKLDSLAAIIEKFCEPQVAIVSLTITEKGYCIDPATGKLDMQNSRILHDLEHPSEPHSAPGILVEALHRRRERGLPAFTVLSCDNIPDNGHVVKNAVLGMAGKRSAELAAWIEAHVSFPGTMVDRIVPAATDASLAEITRELGVEDPCAISCEPFIQWVVEDNFVAGRPQWEKAGAELVADVVPFEEMKLRMLNGSHSFLAYLGYLAGYQHINDCMQDDNYRRAALALMLDEQAPTLKVQGVDLSHYASLLIDRYCNPALKHRTWQIAMDGSQKLPQRMLDSVRWHLAHQHDFTLLALGVAGWMRYVGGVDDAGQAIEICDPLLPVIKEAVAASADGEARVKALLGIEAIFGRELPQEARFVSAVTRAYVALQRQGAKATVASWAEAQ